MQITIDTNNLSELDIAMLGFLAQQGPADEAEVETEVEPEKPAKAAPKKVAAKVAEPEPEVEDEDLVGGKTYTLSDAVARATALVSDGKAQLVKKALETVGAKRVSEISEDQIEAFLSALP